MTPIADMVEQMLSTGIPPEMIVLAIRTAETCGKPLDKTAERRREWDRNRKRAQAEARNSTGIPPDACSALSLSLSSSSLNKNSNQEKEERKKERNNGRRLPAEWCPNEKHYAEGAKIGFNRTAVDAQAEDMRLWARANEHRAVARKSNWDMTFSGWMRRNKPNGTGSMNGRSNQIRAVGATGRSQTGADAILAGMGRIAARIAERNPSAGSDDGPIQEGLDLTQRGAA